MRRIWAAALLSGLIAACGQGGGKTGPAASKGPGESVWVVGSTTVFPFATRVAENFARKTGAATPRVEGLGTGAGLKAFCAGVGAGTPDIAAASRPIKPSEFDACVANGAGDIVEIKIGYDGVVVATAKDGADYDLRLQDIYLGLAKDTPQGGGFAANPARTWRDVSASLPAQRIQVYGPPPTSGTRDAWLELAMGPGAESIPALKALKTADDGRFKTISGTLRGDGAWIDAGENDNALVQTLTRTPGALGVLGYSYLEQNRDMVKGARIAGVAPTFEAIADGSYPLARSLYIYVKKAHTPLKPALKSFIAEFVSEAAAGRTGYLRERGLIPLSVDELTAQQKAAAELTPMSKPAG